MRSAGCPWCERHRTSCGPRADPSQPAVSGEREAYRAVAVAPRVVVHSVDTRRGLAQAHVRQLVEQILVRWESQRAVPQQQVQPLSKTAHRRRGERLLLHGVATCPQALTKLRCLPRVGNEARPAVLPVGPLDRRLRPRRVTQAQTGSPARRTGDRGLPAGPKSLPPVARRDRRSTPSDH